VKQGEQSGKIPVIDAALGDEPDGIYWTPVYSPHGGRLGTDGVAGPQ